MTPHDYQAKIALLKKWAHHYYVLDDPIASDADYDALYADVAAFEAQNPSQIDPSSPTQRVGESVQNNFYKITHLEKMWSLEDAFSSEDLAAWIARIGAENATFMCDAKFDGASLNLTYKNGALVSAATRGDGSVGEAVLENAKTINSIPLSIPYRETIEIRGEVVMAKDDFWALNLARQNSGESIFANPRNAAAGSLRNLDPRITKSRKLRFIPWGFGACSLESDSFFARLNFIKTLGFINTNLCKICRSQGEIEAFYRHLINSRESCEIMLDGMVVRLDSIAAQSRLGHTIKTPRFAIAYKFPPQEKQTRLLGVSFSVGRSGAVTPVAELEAVNIEGATITRATLHNFEEIARKDLRVGDSVVIIRSGDVIPKIIKPVTALRNGSETPVTPPTNCPVCGQTLLVEKILIKCQNLRCEARVKGAIEHFCSKKAMDIDGMGEKIIDFLFENALISGIADIYKLRGEMLQNREGWQEKKIANLISSIEASKHRDLWRFINALGIEHIGEGASKKLAAELGFSVFSANLESLTQIDGIGIESATSLVGFMDLNGGLVSELLGILNLRCEGEKGGVLAGEVIVLSGALSQPRERIAAWLESLGAEISNTVGKKTTMLILGENGGSKAQKARELGIKILSEAELRERIGG